MNVTRGEQPHTHKHKRERERENSEEEIPITEQSLIWGGRRNRGESTDTKGQYVHEEEQCNQDS